MPFVRDRVTRAAGLSLIAATLAVGSIAAVAQPRSGVIGDDEIARARETVRADPNLSGIRTVRMLRWKDSDRRDVQPGRLAWLKGLFFWMEESARLLVWGSIAVFALLVAAYVVRLTRWRPATGDEVEEWTAPSHVRSLDIRPETLPADVGGAARALWDRGDRRAALALLYRGLLSRLAHVHGAPIRDSSTEGDCLALAAARLSNPRLEYASRLVHVWQRLVYGHASVDEAAVHALCDGFGPMLDRTSHPGSEPA